jgi:DNA gyrase subunit A
MRLHEVERLTILDAFAAATARRDELIHVVGESGDADEACRNLMAVFGFSEIQARAALDLQIRRFATYERGRIAAERDDIKSRLESR